MSNVGRSPYSAPHEDSSSLSEPRAGGVSPPEHQTSMVFIWGSIRCVLHHDERWRSSCSHCVGAVDRRCTMACGCCLSRGFCHRGSGAVMGIRHTGAWAYRCLSDPVVCSAQAVGPLCFVHRPQIRCRSAQPVIRADRRRRSLNFNVRPHARTALHFPA